MTRGLSPAATHQTYPAEKKRRNFKEEQLFGRAAVSAALLSRFSQQPFSAALLSSFSQQPFSAALLSSSSQRLFSAAFLSSSSQQLFSAAFLSSFSQQPFSAALLSSFSQQPFSAALLSSFSQQPFSAALLSRFSQQIFSAALLSYHLAVVRGWWSASNIIFSSSLSSSSQQIFSAALRSYHLAVVRGWWSASNIIFSSSSQQLFSAIILLWSGVGGQVCYRSLEGPFRNAFGNRDAITVWSCAPLPNQYSSLQSNQLLASFPKSCPTTSTFARIWEWLLWSFSAHAKGFHPKEDPFGKPSKKGIMAQLARHPLQCQGFRAVMLSWRQ